jgi:tetratricopeptide (TPR) repeat protein
MIGAQRRQPKIKNHTSEIRDQVMTHSSRLSALCDKIIEAGWIAAIVLVPLFFNVYSSRVFEPDKLTLLRSIALLMIGAWLVRWIEERGQNHAERTDRITRRTPLILPTLVLIGVYLITSVLSIAPRVSFLGSYQRLQGTYTMLSYIVVFWMILQNMRQRAQLDRLVTAVVMTSLPIAFYGLLQHGEIDPLPWGGDVTVRVASNMGNAIFVAAYLIMAFFLTLGRVVESFRVILSEQESRLSDILRASTYVFIAAVQLITFGFADSRGPLLGWLPGMFIFGLVGLLLLRVTLHSQNAAASADPAVVRYPITAFDVLKAAGMSLACIAGAGLGALLIFKLFETPKITLVVVVALLGGLLPLLIVAGVRRTAARWLWTSWILFSIVGAIGLFLVNFSDLPFVVELRQSGAFGRLSALFETEGGTGKVRSLIWQGAVQLITPHAPLTFPDGSQDNLNFLRPLIGYGPEAMYVAYNPFYPPDLAHVEARNASPDRSHNETWDSLVITGAIGFLAEQFLFISVFFFALKFIGWIPNRRAAFLLIGLSILGGIGGALLLGIAIGAHFMGPGWTGGVVAGLVLYVIAFALFHYQISRRIYILIAVILIGLIDAAIICSTFTSPKGGIELAAATVIGLVGFAILYFIGQNVFGKTAGQPIQMSGHIFLIIALFGGILAHYMEIGLAGIAIASTRTYFFTYAALLIVAGLHWIPAEDEAGAKPIAAPAATPAAAAPHAPTNVPRHKKKTQRAVTSAAPIKREARRRPISPWLAPTITLALIGALILVTLGYEFITNAPVNSANLPCSLKTPATSATQLVVNSLTRLPYNTKNVCESSGALLMFAVTWLFGGLLSIAELRRRGTLSAKDVLPATVVYYSTTIIIALIYWLIEAGQLLSVSAAIQPTATTTLEQYAQQFLASAENIGNLLVLLYATILLFIVGAAIMLLLEHRTWIGKTAGDWGLVATVPIAIAVIIGVNGTNLNTIRADTIYKQGDPLRQQGQYDLAIAHFKRTIALAPDEDFYYLWLGASYLEKGTQAQAGPTLISDKTSLSDMLNKLTFVQTAQLSRSDSLTIAKTVLEHARALNPLNTDHTANLARLYRRWADLSTDDPAQRKANLNQAGEYYRQATILSPHNAILWNEWATIYISLGDLARAGGDTATADADIKEAQARLDQSLALDPLFEQTYIYRASLDQSLGKLDAAREEYETALKMIPTASDSFQALDNLLLSQGNFTDTETTTLAYLETHPDYVPALRVLGREVYYRQNRLTDVIQTLQRVAQVAPPDQETWIDNGYLAFAYAQSGQLPQALQAGQAAVGGAPASPPAAQQTFLQQLQGLVNQLQAQLGVSPTLTTTVPQP